MLSRLRALLVAALAVAAASASPAPAAERIVKFHSDIAVKTDGSLEVAEHIRVNSEGLEIRRGIYRDFPTKYAIPNGGKMKVGFTFDGATLDGGPVEAKVTDKSNGVRIRLGSADNMLATGIHDFVIRYRVTRELGFFENYDELYWNVTGNGWGFPIEEASASITLPRPASFSRPSAYTGRQGEKGSAARVTSDEPGRIAFATTAPLAPYEGLTIAAAFPKGVVAEPSSSQRAIWWVLDMLPMLAAFGSIGAVLLFLLTAYRRAGRDPKPGTIVPLFAPPDRMSPAAMRYVQEQSFDNRAFAAALVEAGVKGHVRLVEESKYLGLSREKSIVGTARADAIPLDGPESRAIRRLVAPGETLTMDNSNHATFSSARSILADEYAEQYEGKAFKRNYEWIGFGVVVWMIGAYVTALAILLAEGAITGPWLLIPVGMFTVAALLWKAVQDEHGGLALVLKGLAFLAVIVGGFFAISAVPLALSTGRFVPALVALAGLPLVLSALIWISAPTKEGRALLDRIAGFKQYLSITEKERLDRMQAPKDSLTLFERYLPYAIALGVENRWANRFAAQLAAASAAAQGGTAFSWYSGPGDPWTDTGGFVNSLGSSLSNSISSASTAPGSSSGSGGGGFSGGGGGGGGGGGW